MAAEAAATRTRTKKNGSNGAMNAVRAAVSAVGGILFGLTVSASIFLILATAFLNWHVLTLATGSMEPHYAKGDIVITRPVSMAKVKEGDVVFFKEVNTNAPFVHRVAGINTITSNLTDGDTGAFIGQTTEYRFITKGDANTNPDQGEVTYDRYMGKVWIDIPTYGLLAGNAPVQLIFLAAAGVFGALWAGWEILNRRGSSTKRRRRRKSASAKRASNMTAPTTTPSESEEPSA